MRDILIGGAWPYANGSLHIGHIAGLLPGDVLARYHRAIGDNVYFVSGSDCHGTPVAIRARQENRTPQEVSDRYHEEFVECFDKLGFRYDWYTKTSAEEHQDFVREFHRKLYESPYVYEKEAPQAYCEHCDTFLADRFVLGKCPRCGEDTRGDQCDFCGAVLEPETLVEPICAVCGNPISFKNSRHLYIAISKLRAELESLVESHPEWRKNAIAFTNRYISDGLRDRALTRDLEWGIKVPREGYEHKTIYIWAENVLGYLSASKAAAKARNADFHQLWGKEAKHYYVHGKDNIPFHTIILPSLLLANGEGWHLPDQIVSSEYLTLEGKKISTSQNYAIWVKDLLERYEADSIRYFFIANGPEKKDADFSWREFIHSHNGELLGAYGNFVNRSLAFIQKYCGGVVPQGSDNQEIIRQLDNLYPAVGKRIENGCFKDAIDKIFDYVRSANKFFDTEQPWITRNTDKTACENTLYQCVQIIANLAVLLSPFLPFSSEKVIRWLNLSDRWHRQSVPGGYQLPEIGILFQRIDTKAIELETEKLRP
ncbi:MAG: methionine--tRNA ligase [bacterium]|nr:methionine--tRNA ligase [bacterium]MCM1374506.1 methionine--tRNA ligase [Muribaculum sp.]